MINVGDVFSWDNFQFPDGGSADKLFITLGSVGNNLLALKTTSKKHNKIDKAGCYSGLGYFFIDEATTPFRTKTWVILFEPFVFNIKDMLRSKITDGTSIKDVFKLDETKVNEIKNCLRKTPDISAYHESFLK